MRKILLILTTLCLLIFQSYSQQTHANSSNNKLNNKKIDINKTILTIGEQKITFGELKRAYEKTAMRSGILFESLEKDSAIDFINLYTNYKLKVIDGLSRNIDKDSSVKSEIESNRKLLSESYLFDKEVVEPAVNHYLELRKYDKKIALIMTEFAVDGDTVDAYKKINAALREIQNGGTFEFTAKKYSSDSSTAVNGGELPLYVTSLKIQKKLEDALNELKVGEYTKTPIRTEFGYFLLKLLSQKPREIIALSHILIPYKNYGDIPEEDIVRREAVAPDTVAAKKLVDSLYNIITKQKVDFKQLANKFSSDKPSLENNKGGYLGLYSRSTGLAISGEHLVSEVENAAYELKDGEVSKPIQSRYGFHIVKRDSTHNYTGERDEVKATYRRLYYLQDEQKYIDSLASAICGYNLNEKNYKIFLKYVDNQKTSLDSNFYKLVPEDVKSLELYELKNKKYTVNDFLNKILETPELKIVATNNDGFTKAFRVIYRPVVIEAATKNMEEKYPDFATMIKEFRDGIILFKVEADNIWNKLSFDSSLAKKYYDTTSIDLSRPNYYDISEIYIMSEDGIEKIYQDIINNKITFEEAAKQHTQRNSYRDIAGHHGLVSAPKNRLAIKAEEMNLKAGDITKPFNFENGYSIIKINKFEPARKKTFEEAIPDIAPKVQMLYQKQLEEKWISELKKRHKVTINKKAIDEIFINSSNTNKNKKNNKK